MKKNNNRITLNDFSKILAKKTRGYKDSIAWKKDLKLIRDTIGELLQHNTEKSILLPFGTFEVTTNNNTVKKSINGEENVAPKYKLRVSCRCSRHFREIINDSKQ